MTGQVCVFGEVLVDIFPANEHRLGGAPFNVAWHLQAFGLSPLFISRIGKDDIGAMIQRKMRSWGMSMDGLQIDDNLATGKVDVTIKHNEPSYEIIHPVAYDNIQPQQLPENCKLLYHGTLALRDSSSQSALLKLYESEPECVFLDVNLRSPWWDKSAVLDWLHRAHWVKMNSEELSLLYCSDTDDQNKVTRLVNEFNLHGVVLTHGSRGAEVTTADGKQIMVTPQVSENVVDTVGAGDAFAAVVITGLLKSWPMHLTLERAQKFASLIVQQRGATVENADRYRQLKTDWQIQ